MKPFEKTPDNEGNKRNEGSDVTRTTNNQQTPDPTKRPEETGKETWKTPDHTAPEIRQNDPYANSTEKKDITSQDDQRSKSVAKDTTTPGDKNKTGYTDMNQENKNAGIEDRNQQKDDKADAQDETQENTRDQQQEEEEIN